jgi:hypothetical protein
LRQMTHVADPEQRVGVREGMSMGDEGTPVQAELVERTTLRVIPAEVPPRCRASALDLRALFAVLGVSMRTYALRVHLDARALSRSGGPRG